jgi:hypothetical protein
MGSPELTKMADFVAAGRVPEIDGAIADMAAAAIQIGLARPGPRPERPRTGADVAAPRRRDTAAAIAGTRIVAIAGSALTGRPAGGAIARLSAPPG